MRPTPSFAVLLSTPLIIHSKVHILIMATHHSYTDHFLYPHNQAHLTIHKSTHVCIIDVHRLYFEIVAH
jgi:hypothetical protein